MPKDLIHRLGKVDATELEFLSAAAGTGLVGVEKHENGPEIGFLPARPPKLDRLQVAESFRQFLNVEQVRSRTGRAIFWLRLWASRSRFFRQGGTLGVGRWRRNSHGKQRRGTERQAVQVADNPSFAKRGRRFAGISLSYIDSRQLLR